MKSAGTILSFDTATNSCSVALTTGGFSDGRLVGMQRFETGVSHSAKLLDSIDRLLKTVEMTLTDIAAVAIGTGPGSFTGLRIGMATAKGLTHGASLPLIGVSSLDAVAAAVHSERPICVVMDARKKEVYCCFYRCSPGQIATRCSEPMVIDPARLAEQIDEPVTMAGDGLRVYRSLFLQKLENRVDMRPWLSSPSAENIGFLAAAHLAAENFLDLDQAKPDYVRSSDAQLSLVSPLVRR
ncbi:MAG: tRNA (adenosine(37)-N6)-threonylcarbamoyltransferase complex dimerization subunit type 1 TsaB [Desulfofustis sp.]